MRRQRLVSEISSPVRMGVVGAGNFGRLHAFTLAGLAEAELVAIVDDDEAVLNAIRQELPEIRTWTRVGDALQEARAEAWVIATPTESHVPLARQVLSTGADVLIEKPLAESLFVGRQLELPAAPASGKIMLGHILLFATEFRQLLLEVSQRGPLVHFHAARHRPTRLAKLYRESPLRLLMVHDLYLAFALMGGEEPIHVSARVHSRPGHGSDLVRAEMEWPTGTWGSFTASFLTPPGMPPDGFDRLELFGHAWAAQLRLNPQPLEIWAERAEWPLALDICADPAAPSGWLAEELRHFCRVVRGQAEIPLGARYADALRIQHWLEQLESSAREQLAAS